MRGFYLVSIEDRRVRFQELASGAYSVEVLLPDGTLGPHPYILAADQGEALAHHLEGTGLWRREELELELEGG